MSSSDVTPSSLGVREGHQDNPPVLAECDHFWVHRKGAGAPCFVKICSFCGNIDGEDLAGELFRLIGERTAELHRQLSELRGFQTLFHDLDRCPHHRHAGDACAGWRGPGMYDGGCRGGVSLGNDRLRANDLIGYGRHKEIRVPYSDDRAAKMRPENWYRDRK